MELTEGNVQAVFNRCLSRKDSTELIGPILFTKENGYSEDSQPIIFDKAALAENEKAIDYLFGQLQDVHTATNLFTPASITKDYRGNTWTQNKGIILSFLHLGYANRLFDSFVKLPSGSSAYYKFILATRSPNDPTFPEWWEGHRSIWEKER